MTTERAAQRFSRRRRHRNALCRNIFRIDTSDAPVLVSSHPLFLRPKVLALAAIYIPWIFQVCTVYTTDHNRRSGALFGPSRPVAVLAFSRLPKAAEFTDNRRSEALFALLTALENPYRPVDFALASKGPDSGHRRRSMRVPGRNDPGRKPLSVIGIDIESTRCRASSVGVTMSITSDPLIGRGGKTRAAARRPFPGPTSVRAPKAAGPVASFRRFRAPRATWRRPSQSSPANRTDPDHEADPRRRRRPR